MVIVSRLRSRRAPEPAARRTRPLLRRTAAITSIVGLAIAGTGAALGATAVLDGRTDGLVAAGPVSGDNGFPVWYQDKAGVRVELCLDVDNALCGFVPGSVPDPTQPISFPDNFPSEAFYMLAGSNLTLPGGGSAVLTLGLEAAFANGVPVQGDQQAFARQRIVVKNAAPNTAYTFKEPYGTIEVDTDSSGKGRLTEDISPAIGNFTTPLKGHLGPFLKWDSGAPAGYLGDPGVEHTITGSPTGTNVFSASVNGSVVASNDLFTVQGKISTNTGVNADQAILSADGAFLDVFASSEGTNLEVVGQPGAFATTPLLNDPATGRHYARVAVSGPVTSVTVRNLGDTPVSTSKVDVTKPSGITVTKAEYDGAKLTVAATSSFGDPLEVVGYGPLSGSTAFGTAAPPATVSVRSLTDKARVATAPVAVTSGTASPGSLPVVPVTPDPGPVVDSQGGTVTPAATVAKVSASSVSVLRGGSVTLDGSTSTGATSYKWSALNGDPLVITNGGTAQPTVTAPFATTANAAKPATKPTNKATVQLTVTGPSGATSTTNVTVTITTDTLAVTTARARLGSELRVSGTSSVNGAPGVFVPATRVNVYEVTGTTTLTYTLLGSAQVDTLGNWDLRLKPGPTHQVVRVYAESTRGGFSPLTTTTR